MVVVDTNILPSNAPGVEGCCASWAIIFNSCESRERIFISQSLPSFSITTMATSSSETAQLQYEKSHINDTHVPQLIASFAVSLFLAYSAIVLRLTSRRFSRTQLGWDDWIIILSLVSSILFPWLLFLALCGYEWVDREVDIHQYLHILRRRYATNWIRAPWNPCDESYSNKQGTEYQSLSALSLY